MKWRIIKNRLLHHHRLDNRGPTPGKRFLKLKMQTMTHPLFPYNGDLSISHVARCAGVLFVRANVISSRLFIRPIMFDLELELTVGVGGGRRAKRNLHFPSPTPLLIFDRWLPPRYKFPSLHSLLMPLKSKRAAIIFIKKVPSTRSPKLRQLCMLSNMKKSYHFSCYVTSLRSLCFDIVIVYMSLELVPFIYCLARVFLFIWL